MRLTTEDILSRKCLEVDKLMRAWALATAQKDVLVALLKQEKAGD